MATQPVQVLTRVAETLQVQFFPKGGLVFKEHSEADGNLYYILSGKMGVYKQGEGSGSKGVRRERVGESVGSGVSGGSDGKIWRGGAKDLEDREEEEEEEEEGDPSKRNTSFMTQMFASKRHLGSHRGSVAVSDTSESELGILVRVLEGGSVFGERALENKTARSASVVALTSSRTLVVNRGVFEARLRASLRLMKEDMLDFLSRVFAVKNLSSEAQLVYSLAANTSPRRLCKGQLAAGQGCVPGELSLIREGCFAVSKRVNPKEADSEFYRGFSPAELSDIFQLFSGKRLTLAFLGPHESIGEESFSNDSHLNNLCSVVCASKEATLYTMNPIAVKKLHKDIRANFEDISVAKQKNRINVFQRQLRVLLSSEKENAALLASRSVRFSSSLNVKTPVTNLERVREFIAAKNKLVKNSSHRILKAQEENSKDSKITPRKNKTDLLISRLQLIKKECISLKTTASPRFSNVFRINYKDVLFQTADNRQRLSYRMISPFNTLSGRE